MHEPIQFTAPGCVITADLAKRTIRGTAVPFNVVGMTMTGPVKFLPGSLEPAAHLFLRDHDNTAAIGKATGEVNDTAAVVTASISNVQAGDEALVLAADGVLTGLSVGVNPTEYTFEADDQYGEVMVVSKGEWKDTSLVAYPAFTEARITDVAAAAPTNKGVEDMNETVTATAADAAVTEQTPVTIASVPRTPVITATRPMPTPGEWLYASINKNNAPMEWADMQARVRAETAHTLVADVPGLIPQAVVGDVVSVGPSNRPLLDAFGPMSGPTGGSSFLRPVITDPLTDAATATEKTDVTATLSVDPITFTYDYIKRAANLSSEAIAFTSPQVLDVVIRDLRRAYDRGSEIAVTARFVTAGSAPAAATLTDGDEVADLYVLAADMFSTLGVLPDRLILSPDMWAHFGGLVATDGRPVFPSMGQMNAAGSSAGVSSFDLNILGLRPVVTWALAEGSAYLASSQFVESYEAHVVSMRADEPTILGVALGIGGAVTINELVDGAIRKIEAEIGS